MFNTSTDNSIVTIYLCNRYFLQYQDTRVFVTQVIEQIPEKTITLSKLKRRKLNGLCVS